MLPTIEELLENEEIKTGITRTRTAATKIEKQVVEKKPNIYVCILVLRVITKVTVLTHNTGSPLC